MKFQKENFSLCLRLREREKQGNKKQKLYRSAGWVGGISWILSDGGLDQQQAEETGEISVKVCCKLQKSNLSKFFLKISAFFLIEQVSETLLPTFKTKKQKPLQSLI